jgi:integrase
MKITTDSFHGVFREVFTGYVEYKRSLGFGLSYSAITSLLKLNDYLEAYDPDEPVITREMAEGYIRQNEGKSTSTIHGCESRIRQVGLYMKNMGYENVYVYPEKHIKAASDFVPYIFSKGEMESIFKATDILTSENRKRYQFYQVEIRLLYATAMRVGETLSLRVKDVDFTSNVIKVNNAKNNVTRLIPFNESLRKWLLRGGNRDGDPDDLFFPSPRTGGIRNRLNIRNTFQNTILPKAGISIWNGKYRIRVHDLRHSAACAMLSHMIELGWDPYCALPYLSTMLGHKGIESTEKYLRLTQEHYDEIVNAGHYIYEKGLGNDNEEKE